MNKRFIATIVVVFILAGLAGAFVIERVQAREIASIQQWEYAQIFLPSSGAAGALFFATDEDEKKQVNDLYDTVSDEAKSIGFMLDIAGRLNWELVAVAPIDGAVLHYLKRPFND